LTAPLVLPGDGANDDLQRFGPGDHVGVLHPRHDRNRDIHAQVLPIGLRGSAIDAIDGGETGASNAITATGMIDNTSVRQIKPSSGLLIIVVLLRTPEFDFGSQLRRHAAVPA